ncbi:MAG: MBL fold metallo-hydrolase [SAR202 cluster bacterium]|nr:MBL fold metallo-hydrolase [SAR202 cluster bacterium]
MELEPGIHQLTFGREPFAGFPSPNAFLVCGTRVSVLIDAGWDDERDHQARMAYMRQVGAPPVAQLLVTHRHADHAGGALRMRAATGSPIAAHALDKDAIERERFAGRGEVDLLLKEGDSIPLGGLTLHVLFTPGHTAGCLAAYLPERGALFTTDTVMGISTTVVRPNEGDLGQYAEALDALLAIGAKTLYAGHGPAVRDPEARIRTLMRHRQEREEQLLAALASGPASVPGLRERIYGELSAARVPLAEAQVQSGLAKLVRERRAKATDDGYVLA